MPEVGGLIVAMTAHDTKWAEERARAGGGDRYVTAAIDTRALPGVGAAHLAAAEDAPAARKPPG